MTQEELNERAEKKYGRPYAMLTPEQQLSVQSEAAGLYQDFDSQDIMNQEHLRRSQATRTPAKGKRVGADGRIYVAPTFMDELNDLVAGGIAGWEKYRFGKSSQETAESRETATKKGADLAAQSAAAERRRQLEEDERQRQFMMSLMGGR